VDVAPAARAGVENTVVGLLWAAGSGLVVGLLYLAGGAVPAGGSVLRTAPGERGARRQGRRVPTLPDQDLGQWDGRIPRRVQAVGAASQQGQG